MRRFIISFFVFACCVFSLAQHPAEINMEGEVVPSPIRSGEGGKWMITVVLSPNVHISDASGGMFFVTPKPVQGIRFGEPVYPKGVREPYGAIYRGRVVVEVPFGIEASAVAGERTLIAEAQVQSCGESDGVCYPPEIKKVSSKMIVLPAKENMPLSAKMTGISECLADALERGSFLAFLLVFAGGVLTSLTPCVYPMIPITLAVIGTKSAGGKVKGFVLSLFYVLGIAITFSALGILAAKTGALFGAYLQHPIVLIVISLIFFLMGLSMLGVFTLQMPASLAGRLRSKKRSGYVGVLLTGLLAGLIVSPCISPLLVVILAWVAKTGNTTLGFGLLFSFALGLGVLFILIGTFSGVLKNLPKSGGWTEYIEKLFGVLLVILSIYFVRTVVSPLAYQVLWAIFLLFLGTFLGGLSPLNKNASWKRKASKALGLLAMFISACLLFFGFARYYGFLQAGFKSTQNMRNQNSLWLTSDEEGFVQAKASGKMLVMDFFAEWCAACKELDEKTWPDNSVQTELSRFIRVKMDLTRQGEITAAIQKKYNVVGLPTVILFNSARKELARFSGFKPPEEIKEFLRKHVRLTTYNSQQGSI